MVGEGMDESSEKGLQCGQNKGVGGEVFTWGGRGVRGHIEKGEMWRA